MINWIKQNKLTAFLLIIVLYFLFFQRIVSGLFGLSTKQATFSGTPSTTFDRSAGVPEMGVSKLGSISMPNIIPPQPNYPPTDTQNRLVVQESNLSLLVKNVREVADLIVTFAQKSGGYMVSSSLANPQDVASATVVIRIPAEKLKETLEFLRGNAVKVVSENLWGEDVTDQYTDINARLATLNTTKAKFEEIMTKATEVQDILNVQREIINLQSQIDSLKGQQLYMEKTAQLAKITVYLSTDELALPYAPSETWRPDVIFKTAVRSLIQNVRNLGTLLIWAGVYSVIWVPVLVLYLIYRRRKSSKSPTQSS